MAHQIVNNQLAYQGATPWHNLGYHVPDGTSGADMLAIAGLDWRVQRRSLAMRGLLADGTVDKSLMLTAPLEDFRAITRSDNNEVFQIASAGYKPVQNAEIVDFFKEFCDAGNATMETVGALRGGAVVWALAKLAVDATVLRGNDELRGYMLLATSHDGSMNTIGMPTQVRVVCANTLHAAFGAKQRETTYRLKHSAKFDAARKAEAKKVMGLAIEQTAKTHDLAAQLANVSISESDWLDYMTRVMGADSVIDPKTADLTRNAQAIKEATMTSPGSALQSARGTLWGALNGVTYYVDHAARSRSESNRLFSAWFGNGNQLKEKALEVAAEMAGVAR